MHSHKPSILVVDDEVDNCRNLADIFDDLGYRVDTAQDGNAALRLVRKQRYDVAVLDLMMPGMDGTTLYSEIKKVRPEIVALMVTAYPAHPRAVDALSAGVQRLVAKPVDCRELTALIGEVVRRPLLLVVDGDANLCATLGDVLCERGYRVCVAISVANAMDSLAEDEFCVILLDLVLPDGNGSQVFQTARACNPAACVVVISGCQAEIEPQIRQLSAEGASAVFRKPVDVPRLMAELSRLSDAGWQSPA